MKIFTDSKEYASKTFTIKPEWQKVDTAELADILLSLIKKLFYKSTLYTTEIESNPLLKYAFIVEHASQSQFSILMEVLRNNTVFQEGILCLAGSGKNFKGYRDRKWESLPGNIHLSVFLNPNCPVKNFHTGFTILSAVSVVETIDQLKGMENKADIKWVNDILINGAKVSGVLTQSQTLGNKVNGVFLGIGLNVETTPSLQQDRFVPLATSLNDHVKCNMPDVLKNLLKNIAKSYKTLIDGGYNQLLDLYRKRSIVLGKEITVYSDPKDGLPQITAMGKVLEIGENLELRIEDFQDPVTRGRITF